MSVTDSEIVQEKTRIFRDNEKKRVKLCGKVNIWNTMMKCSYTFSVSLKLC